MPLRCPQCGTEFEQSSADDLSTCPECGHAASGAADVATIIQPHDSIASTQDLVGEMTQEVDVTGSAPPEQLGRYRIRKPLGEGSFGTVYLAFDAELHRLVAVKVPKLGRSFTADEADAYIAEARVLARLDHPHIVPVHDVGRTDDGLCYVVSKYVEGSDLSELIARGVDLGTAVRIVVMVAEALDHTHQQGLIHRDVKPANVLLDEAGNAFVADFGLALEEEIALRGITRIAGTPAYMSPEQLRGEGHRVDARADIYSLGVVLYEVLTGQKPFTAPTITELVQVVLSTDPRPACEVRSQIPAELERICSRAMSRRAADRYHTAAEMADDLRYWLRAADEEDSTIGAGADRIGLSPPSRTDTPTTSLSQTAREHDRDRSGTAVEPKGLKSFDAEDAEFFLQLLPGPTDRDGLPDSVRFWKTRIEEVKADATFNVGLIYGPSGCGKSSMVKAGLIPRLADHVHVVYFEATPDDTEARLMRGLSDGLPGLDPHLDMTQALSLIRRSAALLPPGQKVLIVIDQFEQWLHAHRTSENTELVQALRQADGERVQAVVMVRDDFWRMATRFMHDLEVPLVEEGNSAMVDLFSKRHARKVLALFGRALGCLPQDAGEITPYQELFLNRAAEGLAVDGSIISVRLSLFAEMFRNKEWSPDALSRVGGTEGIGVTFLEEQFGGEGPEKHRAYQEEIRAVLNELLPPPGTGTDIKGEARSYEELFHASRCAGRDQFDELLGILDTQLRLITPTEGAEPAADGDQQAAQTATQYFQLTHDYLVPALRNWLTQKQRESMRGRAELRLAERAGSWNSKPEPRHLPAAWEWINISLLARHRDWTTPQRLMMAAANRFYALRGGLTALLILAVVFAGLQIRRSFDTESNELEAEGLVKRLKDAETSQVPGIVDDIEEFRTWTDPELRGLLVAEDSTEKTKVHASLALLPVDKSQVEFLRGEMLDGALERFPVVRDGLQDSLKQIEAGLWNVLHDNDEDADRRFRAGMALAKYAPADNRWTSVDAQLLAEQLVTSSFDFQRELREFLRPVAAELLDPIEVIFRDSSRGESERISSASALADYAARDPVRLSELVAVADPKQHEIIFDALFADAENEARALEVLTGITSQSPPDEMPPPDRVAFGRRRAGAAVTLLRKGQHEAVLDAFHVDGDAESLSQTIHRLKQRGVGAEDVLACLEAAAGETERFGLLLALGEFALDELPPTRRDETVALVEVWYANDPSSAIHGAAGWLLRQWDRMDAVARVDRQPVPYDPTGRQWFIEEVAGEFLTWIVFPPGEAMIGSHTDEPGRKDDEAQITVQFTRPYALCQSEVTLSLWDRFQQETGRTDEVFEEHSLSPDVPVCGPTWYTSVLFCRWLTKAAGRTEAEQCYVAAADVPESQQVQLDDGSSFPRNWPIQPERTGFRLPTEAEWERGCRAGTRTAFYFGNDEELFGHYAWWNGNSERRSHLPGTARPNLRGLYDMHGNIFEWCHDWYGEFSETVDPLGAGDGTDRIVRGGGWFNSAVISRSSARHHEQSSSHVYYSGCRIARTLPPLDAE